eukprot:10196437-Prorocentrum_lima.AAC.1
MDVQQHRPAAQLRGLFRTVVLLKSVHHVSTGSSQTEPHIHHLWFNGQGQELQVQTVDQSGLHLAAM